MSALSDAGLCAYYVWVPMLPADNRAEAEANSRRFAEPRATHYCDGERHLAAYMGRALGIGAKESIGVEGSAGPAWDVYLAYRRGNGDIESPDFWMHQLAVKHAPRLDADEWHRRLRGMIDDWV